ncbi:hypothetical protein HmCmsJML025_03097 [Escherichia coli]|nr:hypothetical protein HmCmsJML025_03097 [Escherichia coli]
MINITITLSVFIPLYHYGDVYRTSMESVNMKTWKYTKHSIIIMSLNENIF